MPQFGMGELVIVFLCLLLVFGATRLPQIGEGVGKAIRNLKRGLANDDDIEVTPNERRVESTSTRRASAREEISEAEVVKRS